MDRLLEATARAERDHFWFRGFRRFIEPLVADAARGVHTEILDCGCGTGHNLHLLRKHGHAYGIDLTWAGLEYSRRNGERLVPPASPIQLPFPPPTFHPLTSLAALFP